MVKDSLNLIMEINSLDYFKIIEDIKVFNILKMVINTKVIFKTNNSIQKED